MLDEKSPKLSSCDGFGGGVGLAEFVDVFGFADFAVENNEENASLFVLGTEMGAADDDDDVPL